uniref:Protein GOLM2 n=1 Tax=Leptobrachium leishanense TaxID=445787 RepID=A0A8C5PKE3_9ANUR
MVGFGAPRRNGRMPPFVLIALLAVIGLLAFNYWSVSARQAALQDELLGLQAQVQRIEVARSRLEKRNSELMMQADTHRRQMEQRQDEYQGLGERLQARDVQAQRCELDRTKLQANISHQVLDINHLKEQLAELKQEFLRQEDQLHEFKNNNTLLQKMLQEESQQCKQHLLEQKREYEEKLGKNQAQEKGVLDQLTGKSRLDAAVESKTVAAEENKEDPSSNRPNTDKEAPQIDSDAGMPEIEDSDPAKVNIVPTVGNKVEDRVLPNDNTIQLSKKLPSIPPKSFTEAKVKSLVPAVKKEKDLMGVDSVLAIGPPVQKQIPRETKVLAFPNVKQSRFFDENESPVDPQHGSKIADYNGDDGNVGEYEADKQAELAYNEEDDGDGGEDDVQGPPNVDGLHLQFTEFCD